LATGFKPAHESNTLRPARRVAQQIFQPDTQEGLHMNTITPRRPATRPGTALRGIVCAILALQLAACGGGDDDEAPPSAGASLTQLYGRLTLNYRFVPGTATFTDAANFSAASRSTDGSTLVATVVGVPTRVIGCALNTVSGYPYAFLCVISDFVFGTTELFAFNLNGRNVSGGTYEYCPAGTSLSACTTDLLATPDGEILGTSGVFAADRGRALGVQAPSGPAQGIDAAKRQSESASPVHALPASATAAALTQDMLNLMEAARTLANVPAQGR
jgi:hypothetical protein